MNDPRDHRDQIEEYLDGLLPDEERAEFEAALERSDELRVEVESARRFERLLDRLGSDERDVRRVLAEVVPPRRARIVKLAAVFAVAAAAALVAAIVFPRGERTHGETTYTALEAEWTAFGQRLGSIAAERRTGRVPRQGRGDFDIPPARAYGIVFRGALDRLGVAVEDDSVLDLVRDHFVRLRGTSEDAAGEQARSEASLRLYRDLRARAGRDVADAFYDVFRPGLATPRSVERVRRDALVRALEADRAARYIAEYERALNQLERRYGADALAVALDRMAGADRRFLYRDAAQDGVGPDAVLAIRDRLYRVARDLGAPTLYLISS
ncbi:MAG: hypothetical protein ACYTGN_03820 [Planctomycetota bacterium]|jgi:hypothetical protein